MSQAYFKKMIPSNTKWYILFRKMPTHNESKKGYKIPEHVLQFILQIQSNIHKFLKISNHLYGVQIKSIFLSLTYFSFPSAPSSIILPSPFPSHTLQQPLLPSLPLSLHFFPSFLFPPLLAFPFPSPISPHLQSVFTCLVLLLFLISAYVLFLKLIY